jgi:hypothetical protein
MKPSISTGKEFIMEVLEKGKILSIKAGQRFPIKKILVDAGIVLILIWGIFAYLVLFLSQQGNELFPYFIPITLLLVVPLIAGILIRQFRNYREIIFDGERGALSLKGMGGWRQLSFHEIKALRVETYRFKKNLLLYRLVTVLSSGKTLRLIQDVPEKEALNSLAKKAGALLKKPLKVDP